MISSVSSSRVGSVSAIGKSRGGKGTRTGAAMNLLAGRVASSLAREFDLTGDEQKRQNFNGNEDLYDIEATADDLNKDLGGRPVDRSNLARSLSSFVMESASLIGARPESLSLEQIEWAIGESETSDDESETVTSALAMIDTTTGLVAQEMRL